MRSSCQPSGYLGEPFSTSRSSEKTGQKPLDLVFRHFSVCVSAVCVCTASFALQVQGCSHPQAVNQSMINSKAPSPKSQVPELPEGGWQPPLFEPVAAPPSRFRLGCFDLDCRFMCLKRGVGGTVGGNVSQPCRMLLSDSWMEVPGEDVCRIAAAQSRPPS